MAEDDGPPAVEAAKRKHRQALDKLQEAIRGTEGNGKAAHRRVERASRREMKARAEHDQHAEEAPSE